MERDYTVGALLTLILILVVALVVYWTVPDFNEAVKNIADEVFKMPFKSDEEKTYEVLEKITEGYKDAKGGDVGCVYDIDLRKLSEDYEIRFERIDGKKYISVYYEENNLKSESFQTDSFCVMKTDKAKINHPALTIDDDLKIRSSSNEKFKFMDGVPELYKLDDNTVCLVTDEAISYKSFFNSKNDCVTGKNMNTITAEDIFDDFIERYKACKFCKGTNICKCGEFDFDSLPEGYVIQVKQGAKDTTFYLKNTNREEVILNNEIKKMVNPWYSWGYNLYDYNPKETIDGEFDIICHMGNWGIYLADHSNKEPDCVFDEKDYTFDRDLEESTAITTILEHSEPARNLESKHENIISYVYEKAGGYDVDVFLVFAVILTESSGRSNEIGSSGEIGLMQLMPGTANQMKPGIKLYDGGYLEEDKDFEGRTKAEKKETSRQYSSALKDLVEQHRGDETALYVEDERFNPWINIDLGVKYLRWVIDQLEDDENLEPTFENILAAYNAGLGNVKNAGGIPNSMVQNHVNKVCNFYEKFNPGFCK